MRVTQTAIPGVLVVEPKVFEDARGFFFESFSASRFNEITGLNTVFVQDNHSKSQKHVLRGLHYQIQPKEQGKLVRVVRGAVFDVAVDIRKNSKTYGMWVGELLSAENKRQLWIPPGFAHGFLTLTDTAECFYKTTDYYSINHERTIRWNDPTLKINWPIQGDPIISEKDATAPYLDALY